METCIDCSSLTNKYVPFNDGSVLCSECIGKHDIRNLEEGFPIILYVKRSNESTRIVNYFQTLNFEVVSETEAKHNIAGIQKSYYFVGPGGFKYVAKQYGTKPHVRAKKLKRQHKKMDTIKPPCIIKVNGDIIPVSPENGKDFKLSELYKHIGCDMVQCVPLKSLGTELWCDEEGMYKKLLCNPVATTYTALDAIQGPNGIVGDVLIIKPGQVE